MGITGSIRNILGLKPFVGFEELSYRRLAEKKFQPDGIIDVGAYHGEWTRLARKVFLDVPVFMIEAQDTKRPMLEKVCSDLPGVTYASVLLGATTGEVVNFYEMETGSSFYAEQSNAPRSTKKMCTETLSEVTKTFPGENLFLKIDVQGAELQVLEGGTDILNRCEVVQLEVAMLPYNEGAPTMLQVLSYMDNCDFVPFDISGESRPKGHLVQIDVLFTRRDSVLRPSFINF